MFLYECTVRRSPDTLLLYPQVQLFDIFKATPVPRFRIIGIEFRTVERSWLLFMWLKLSEDLSLAGLSMEPILINYWAYLVNLFPSQLLIKITWNIQRMNSQLSFKMTIKMFYSAGTLPKHISLQNLREKNTFLANSRHIILTVWRRSGSFLLFWTPQTGCNKLNTRNSKMEITFIYGSQNSYFDFIDLFDWFIKKNWEPLSCTQNTLRCQNWNAPSPGLANID